MMHAHTYVQVGGEPWTAIEELKFKKVDFDPTYLRRKFTFGIVLR